MSPDIPFAFDAIWVRFAIGFIVGGVLGSFATMLAYRLPRRLSIVLPRSHCTSCNKILGVRDLVPIFSWLAMRGRCRHCHAKFGVKYLIIEVATSLACGSASIMIGFSPWLAVAYAAIVAAVVLLSLTAQRKFFIGH